MKQFVRCVRLAITTLVIIFMTHLFTDNAFASQPVQVSKISGKMALFQNGTVWVWGDNPYGSDGSTFEPKGLKQPIQIKELSGIIDIANGGGFSVALKKDGTIWAWGSNQNGTLGNGQSIETEESASPLAGPKPYSQKPIQVKSLSDVSAIATKGGHLLALRKDGTVWTWGQNGGGQLGTGESALIIPTPRQVQGLPPIKAISAGWFHSVALDVNGEVWTWGENHFGKAGDGTESEDKNTPVKVKNLTDVTKIIAVANWYNIAVKQDGSVWFWGKNNVLSFSHDATDNQLIPKEVPELRGIRDIQSSYYFTLILKEDGTVWSLGYNKFGQLGDGTKRDHMEPNMVKVLSGVIGIENDDESAFALKKDGTVWGWGRNDNGQLGNKNRFLFLTPRQLIFNGETPIVKTNIEVFVDDVLVPLHIAPKTINGSLYISAGELGKKLGYTSSYQSKSKLLMKLGQKTIVLEDGSKKISINGKNINQDKPVIAADKEFWVPVNSLSSLFKVKVSWESKNQILSIKTK